MKAILFYTLSFTWGLPVTLVGCVVAAALRIAGHRPKRWGWCWYFEVGEKWGGLELGVFFLVNRKPSRHIRCHELGHALQNCVFGPLTPLIVGIPSAARYWYRLFLVRVVGVTKLPPYDAIWFEGQATRWGEKFMKTFVKEN